MHFIMISESNHFTDDFMLTLDHLICQGSLSASVSIENGSSGWIALLSRVHPWSLSLTLSRPGR